MRNIPTITPRWLKPLDAVRYSGMSIATIRRHIASKSFASSLVGRVRLIDRVSLDKFIESEGG